MKRFLLAGLVLLGLVFGLSTVSAIEAIVTHCPEGNWNCIIIASGGCNLADIDTTISSEIEGVIITTDIHQEIFGYESGKCSYFARKDAVVVTITPAYNAELLAIPWTQDQINQLIAILNQAEQAGVGLGHACKFGQQELTNMLGRWKNNDFDGGAVCTLEGGEWMCTYEGDFENGDCELSEIVTLTTKATDADNIPISNVEVEIATEHGYEYSLITINTGETNPIDLLMSMIFTATFSKDGLDTKVVSNQVAGGDENGEQLLLVQMVESGPDDSDGDGINDENDNCPSIINSDQLDTDGDDLGDVCDNDDDGDGIDDDMDNCPLVSNSGQTDTDGDGVGNACDTGEDTDGDGVDDGIDNCPLVSNSGQADSDGDGVGDACELDSDGDGIEDALDNCPNDPNSDQADSDGNGVGDACEEDVPPEVEGLFLMDEILLGVGETCEDNAPSQGYMLAGQFVNWEGNLISHCGLWGEIEAGVEFVVHSFLHEVTNDELECPIGSEDRGFFAAGDGTVQIRLCVNTELAVIGQAFMTDAFIGDSCPVGLEPTSSAQVASGTIFHCKVSGIAPEFEGGDLPDAEGLVTCNCVDPGGVDDNSYACVDEDGFIIGNGECSEPEICYGTSTYTGSPVEPCALAGECVDPDGINLYVKGTALIVGDLDSAITDSCEGPDVVEAQCFGGTPDVGVKVCPLGEFCSGGVCIEGEFEEECELTLPIWGRCPANEPNCPTKIPITTGGQQIFGWWEDEGIQGEPVYLTVARTHGCDQEIEFDIFEKDWWIFPDDFVGSVHYDAELVWVEWRPPWFPSFWEGSTREYFFVAKTVDGEVESDPSLVINVVEPVCNPNLLAACSEDECQQNGGLPDQEEGICVDAGGCDLNNLPACTEGKCFILNGARWNDDNDVGFCEATVPCDPDSLGGCDTQNECEDVDVGGHWVFNDDLPDGGECVEPPPECSVEDLSVCNFDSCEEDLDGYDWVVDEDNEAGGVCVEECDLENAIQCLEPQCVALEGAEWIDGVCVAECSTDNPGECLEPQCLALEGVDWVGEECVFICSPDHLELCDIDECAVEGGQFVDTDGDNSRDTCVPFGGLCAPNNLDACEAPSQCENAGGEWDWVNGGCDALTREVRFYVTDSNGDDLEDVEINVFRELEDEPFAELSTDSNGLTSKRDLIVSPPTTYNYEAVLDGHTSVEDEEFTVPEGSGTYEIEFSLTNLGITWDNVNGVGGGDCPQNKFLVEVDEWVIVGFLNIATDSDKQCADFERGDGTKITWDGTEDNINPRADGPCPEDMALVGFSEERFIFTWSSHILCKGMEDADGNTVEWDPDTIREITGRCDENEIAVGSDKLGKTSCAEFII